jgi:TRAP-type C4-dicarboxylate transport system permease small subunit
MKVLKRADEILTTILKWFVTGLCIGIGVILLLRVLIRFTPIILSISWTDEIVEWMMAWMIFTGATLLVRQSDHFRVDLLQTKFKGRTWVHILNVFITLLSIVFFAALLYYTILLVKGATWFSPILKVSTRVPYASMPVNCVLILFYLIRDLVAGFGDLTKRRRPLPADAENGAV